MVMVVVAVVVVVVGSDFSVQFWPSPKICSIYQIDQANTLYEMMHINLVKYGKV